MKEPWKDGSPVHIPGQGMDIHGLLECLREGVCVDEGVMIDIIADHLDQCRLALDLLVEARDSVISDDWKKRVREFLEEVWE